MIISDPRRMNGGKLRLKTANKSNILKNPSCLCRFLLTLIQFIIAAIHWSPQNQGIYLLLLVHPVWPFVLAHNTFWILRCNCPVITQPAKWSILGGTQALNILECPYALVLLFIVLLSFSTSSCCSFIKPQNTNASLQAKPTMFCVITVSLVGLFCHWHVTKLATGLIKSLSRLSQINWNKNVFKSTIVQISLTSLMQYFLKPHQRICSCCDYCKCICFFAYTWLSRECPQCP